jgi:PAS domain S-box-containing protein
MQTAPKAGHATLAASKPANARARSVWLPNESDELLRLAVQVGGIGIYDSDIEHNRTRFSPELCAILGLPPGSEMTFTEASRLFDARDRAVVNARVEAARRSPDEGKWDGLHRIVRADGAVRWVAIHGRRFYRDTSGGRQAVRSIGTVIDVTHLKETEAALRESELRLRLALEAAQMGTFEAHTNGQHAIIDAQQARLLGLSEDTRVVAIEELRGRIPLADLEVSDAKKRTMEQTAAAYHHEFRMRMANGSERWLSARAAVRGDRTVGVSFDVTERKRAEEALRESEARLRIATNGAALGVFEWDIRTDQTIWVNDRMYEIFGHARADGILTRRQFVERYLHADDVSAFEAALKTALRSGENFHLVCRIRQKNGSRRWLQLDGIFEFAPDGEPLRLLGVAADVTQRKVLERKTRELSERLITLQEEERQRIAQELHDSTAQHLVAASLTLMGLRPKGRLKGEQERLWNEVEASMGEALKELRTFTYLLYPVALRDDGLQATVQQYVDGYSNRAGLAIGFKLSPKVDNLPFRTQQSLFRILQETLTNVYRHASASHVSIQLRWIARRLHLVITDNGHGAAGAVERESADFRPGIGIRGIKARVDQLGGDLRIRTSSRGTRVHVVVPVD